MECAQSESSIPYHGTQPTTHQQKTIHCWHSPAGIHCQRGRRRATIISNTSAKRPRYVRKGQNLKNRYASAGICERQWKIYKPTRITNPGRKGRRERQQFAPFKDAAQRRFDVVPFCP